MAPPIGATEGTTRSHATHSSASGGSLVVARVATILCKGCQRFVKDPPAISAAPPLVALAASRCATTTYNVSGDGLLRIVDPLARNRCSPAAKARTGSQLLRDPQSAMQCGFDRRPCAPSHGSDHPPDCKWFPARV